MTAPIPPQPEPWPPPASRPTAVVGGLPWAQPSGTSTGPLVVVTEPRGEAAAEPEGFSWPEMRRRVEAAVQKSPAFSVSLSLHVLLLLSRQTTGRAVEVELAGVLALLVLPTGE